MTPDEIRSREFFVSAEGYDRAEVRRYLAQLADEREAGAWATSDERLLLVLEAARRAVDAVAEDARRTTAELRQIVRDELRAALGKSPPAASPPPAPAEPADPDPEPEPEPEPPSQCEPGRDGSATEVGIGVNHLREQLERALLDVEAALESLGS